MLKQEGGFIVLTYVIIIGAAVLLIAAGISLRSVEEARMSLGEDLSIYALDLANSCAEIAIVRLNNNLNYSGSETIIIDGTNTCRIRPTLGAAGSSLDRIIEATSTILGYEKKVKVDIARIDRLIPILNIRSWKEVSDF